MKDTVDNIHNWIMNDLAFRAPEDVEGKSLQIRAALERAYALGQANAKDE